MTFMPLPGPGRPSQSFPQSPQLPAGLDQLRARSPLYGGMQGVRGLFPGSFGGGASPYMPSQGGFFGGGFGSNFGIRNAPPRPPMGGFSPYMGHPYQPSPGLFGGNPFLTQMGMGGMMSPYQNPFLGQFNHMAGQMSALRPYMGPYTSPQSVGINTHMPFFTGGTPTHFSSGVPGQPGPPVLLRGSGNPISGGA